MMEWLDEKSMKEIIDKKNLRCDFGTSQPIRWVKPEQIKMYDSDGIEQPIPKCEKCGYAKTEIIGKRACTWLCTFCSGDDSTAE